MNQPTHYAHDQHGTPMQSGRDLGQQSQQGQNQQGYQYDSGQQPPSAPGAFGVVSPASEYSNENDVQMEDADPYNRAKYPSRPTHQHRISAQYLGQESSAARRYSPMNVLSPTLPYVSSPKQPPSSYSSYTAAQTPSSRESPSRQSMCLSVSCNFVLVS